MGVYRTMQAGINFFAIATQVFHFGIDFSQQ
jgi:hypothetical protein